MIGRICVLRSNGKLIEFQSGIPELGALTRNAIRSGYIASDILERYVDAEEWKTIERRWVIPLPLLEPDVIISGTEVEIPKGSFYYMCERYEMEATGKLDFSNPETKLSIECISLGNAQYVYDKTGLSPLSDFENGRAVTIVHIINDEIVVMI